MELPILTKIAELQEIVQQKYGFTLLPTSLYRSLEHQARLWRQSRSTKIIQTKLVDLRRDGFSFLATVLESVGPQNGEHVTNACCGESWHNYGLAADLVPVVNGQPIMNNNLLWKRYGESAESIGLIWGGRWPNLVDLVHIQIPKANNPLSSQKPDEVKILLDVARVAAAKVSKP